MSDVFEQLVEAWPSPLVARSEVGKFSGGLLHPRTMANEDSRGNGPIRIIVGRKVAYPTKQLAEWMRSRGTALANEKEEHHGEN